MSAEEFDPIAAFNSHDVEKNISLFADDCIYEDVAFGLVSPGKEELRAFYKNIYTAVPDIKMEAKAFVVSGDWLAIEQVMSGTNTGDFPGLPALGKSFSIRGASISELREGKIKRNSDYYDKTDFLKQLGAIPQVCPSGGQRSTS